MRSLKRGPGGVNDERTQPEKDQKRMAPPDVGPHGLAERTSGQFSSSVRHCVLIMTRSRAFKQMAIPLSRSRRRGIGGSRGETCSPGHSTMLGMTQKLCLNPTLKKTTLLAS